MATFTERPYQTECIQAILDAGPGRHLIALATGLGKTVVLRILPALGGSLSYPTGMSWSASRKNIMEGRSALVSKSGGTCHG